jgi:hypothetical protein
VEPEHVGACVGTVGLEAQSLLAAAGTPDVKEHLRRNTEELLALGGFGVPTVVADEELFFGVDSLGHLERFLLHALLYRMALVAIVCTRTAAKREACSPLRQLTFFHCSLGNWLTSASIVQGSVPSATQRVRGRPFLPGSSVSSTTSLRI